MQNEITRQQAREAERQARIADAIEELKAAAKAGAVRSDINAALEAAGFNDRLVKVEDIADLAEYHSHFAPGATKAQSIEVVAVRTALDVNGNSRHGYLVAAPLLAPLPNGDVGRFFIESPGDNIRDLFDRVPNAQWPSFEVKISRGDFRQFKAPLPEAPLAGNRERGIEQDIDRYGHPAAWRDQD